MLLILDCIMLTTIAPQLVVYIIGHLKNVAYLSLWFRQSSKSLSCLTYRERT